MRQTTEVRNHLLALLLLFLALLPAATNADEAAQEKVRRASGEKKVERMKEDLQGRDMAVHFYGKVLDQSGRPVEGADVVLLATQFRPDAKVFFSRIKELRVQTNSQGCFMVSEDKARSLSVKDMQKEGYEFSLADNPCEVYEYAGPSKRFVPDQDNPVIFHMRKKGLATFLLESNNMTIQVPPAKSGKAVICDFVQRRKLIEGDKKSRATANLVCDLQIKAAFNANDATWAVTLSPGTPNGGIIVSEQMLYEAPETGYQAEYTFTPEDGKPVKAKYIYVRSRDPAIYTRIEIEDIGANKQFFDLLARYVTNPYGDRNLEQATNLPFEVMKPLADDVEAAFGQNKRPARPDLPKMIKEAKDKAEKARQKQGG